MNNIQIVYVECLSYQPTDFYFILKIDHPGTSSPE